jgi:hypothetical protein
MKAMDLLAQTFDTITFQDVVDFCDQKIVENTELDYKMVIPKDLTKHFAAMSNRYGGLIIVGVQEDTATGVPSAYEGIVNDGKQIDRVHQFANNVRPLPTYDVRMTDEVKGKAFLLIRVNEGGAPPYTPKNDPTVYLRTGNITTPLDRADTEIVRELYAKRVNAEGARRANVDRAKAALLSVLEQRDLERPEQVLHEQGPEDSKRFRLTDLDDNFRMLAAWLQPFYPGRELAQPRDIYASLGEVRVMNRVNQSQAFPAQYNVKPMARGMVAANLTGKGDLSFSSDQVHANGFFYHGEQYGTGARGEEAERIYLTDIARVLYATLLFGRKLYTRFAYSGLTRGALQLTGAKGRAVKLILFEGQYQDGYPVAIDAAYRWAIEADTHQLGDDDWLKDYFYKTMREIYWDLGITDVDGQTFTRFLDQWQFA